MVLKVIGGPKSIIDSEESLLTNEARSWIGREWDFGERYVSAEQIAQHVAATGLTSPVHVDLNAARQAGHRDVIAPPMFYRTLARPIVPLNELTYDGVTGDRRPPVGQGRAMNGEIEAEILRPIYSGERIRVVCRLTELEEKVGRSGRFVIVTWVTEFRDQQGALVVRETSKNLMT